MYHFEAEELSIADGFIQKSIGVESFQIRIRSRDAAKESFEAMILE